MSKIRVLLVDGCTLFRQGLRVLLGAEQDLEVVGESANASDAVALVEQLRPDVVLMETAGMLGLSSFEAIRQILKEYPETKVVFLSLYDDEEYLAQAVEVGVSGYVLKDSSVDFLLAGIREVAGGGNYLSPRLISKMMDVLRQQACVDRLTHREQQILKMLAEGQSVRDIAGNLDLSANTVEVHKSNIHRKLGIHKNAKLVQYAIRKKIIRCEVLPDVNQVSSAQLPEEMVGKVNGAL